ARLTAIGGASLAIMLSPVTAYPAEERAQTAGFQLEEATIADITAAFDSGRLTCAQLVRGYLDRIAAYDQVGPAIQSIITVNPQAMATAAQLDAERRATGPRSRLHCIPVLLKDNIDTFDMPTTNGSVILKDAVPSEDAHITRVLREAGALILGKATMGEFAGVPYTTLHGQPLNPYHLERTTSGSSSGSASATAANFTTLAVGTDTSTSVRGPAAVNGVVGLRPTTGLISRNGIAPKNLNFDTAGPIARTVTDTAILLNFLAGRDPGDPANLSGDLGNNFPSNGVDYTQFLKTGSLKGARIGVLREYFGGDPEVDALAEAAIARMKELGADIVDPVVYDSSILDGVRNLADYRFRADFEAYLQRFGPEVPKTVEEFVRIYETDVAASPFPVGDSVMDLLKRSLVTSAEMPEYQNLIHNTLPADTAQKLAIFGKYNVDALVFPYESAFAAPISNPVRDVQDPNYVVSRRPQPATLAGYSSIGFPGIVVPMGFGTQGLPMAISFMARPWDEGKLLGYAYDYEQASKMRRPSPLLPPLAPSAR
ncbi:MAG TPA: amidase family protein, partial [Chloroflexota bacterium]